VMELGSKETISWTRFKEEFCREYSWSLKRSTSRELHSKKEKCRWCHRCSRPHFGKCRSRKNLCYECGKVGYFIRNCNQTKRNGIGSPGRE
jgi:hypothetical protein